MTDIPKNANDAYGKRLGGITVLDRTRPFDSKCEKCGKQEDLRPYGAAGEWICFDCGMKDEAATTKRFMQVAFREGLDS